MIGVVSFAQTTVTITATGTTGSYNTGSVDNTGVKNDGNMTTINQSANRGWAKFDLSSIPSGAIIVSANAVFTTYTSTSSSATNNIYGFTGDPAVMSGTALYTACGSGSSFNATSWTANAVLTKTINSTGLTFIQNNFGGFMNLGYVRGSTNTYNIYGYPQAGSEPQLVITYNVPPACAGTPAPGATNASATSVCPSTTVNFNLPSLTAALGYTYQWQSSPDGITWTNIAGATASTYSSTFSATTYIQCIVTCTNSGLNANSTPVMITVNSFLACYCTSNATSTADEDVFNVTLGSLSNTSSCSTTGGGSSILNEYSDFTAVTAPSLGQSATYSGSIEVGTCGGNYNNCVAMYVDYNQNGSFSDPGEQVYVSSASTSGPHIESFNVTIPLSATPGTTRMRVICVETSTPSSITPCGTYSFGETEDYFVNIVAAVACAGTPSPGATSASSTNVCASTPVSLSLPSLSPATGYTYQWQSSPDNITWTNIAGATNSTYTTTISANTYFQCIVTCTNSGLNATSTPVLVNLNPYLSCYCTTSLASYTSDEDVFNVTFGSLNNSSTCATTGTTGSVLNCYSNFTNITSPTVAQNLTYPFSVEVGTCGGNYSNCVAIYIDYNQNGSLSDPGEQVYLSSTSTTGPHIESGNLTIPVTSTTGTTLMRVICMETGTPSSITPCGSYGWGETEDYYINIIPASPIDLGVTALLNPHTTGCHSATDSVQVTIKNYSTNTIDFSVDPASVNVSVTGVNPTVFTPVVINSGTLVTNATMNVVISTTYNMSAVGNYTFSAWTSQPSDGNPTNDSLVPTVSIDVSGGVATVSPSPSCSGSAVTLSVAGQTNGGTIQWQSSPDNSTWSNIAGATTNPYADIPAATPTYYRALVCGTDSSTSDTAVTISVAPPTTIGDTRCGPGTVNLSASGSGTLDWYTAPTGGTSVNTGTTYAPSVTTTTTYYVENTYTSSGPAGTPATPTCYPNYSFACSSNDYINNFSTTGGITNISNLNTGCNGSSPTNTTFFPAQVVTCAPGSSFDIAVQSGASFGQGFHMWIDYNNDGDFSGAGEDVWLSASSNTTVNTGTITVPSNTAPGPKRIRVMCRYATVPASTDYCLSSASFGEVEEYTLNVTVFCTSTRTPVTATITPPPAMNVTAVNAQLCGNDSTLLTISSGSPDYVFTWSPAANLNTTTGDTVMFHPANAGNYSFVVTAIDTVTGCTNADTISGLSRNVPPTVIASASNDSICRGDTVTLVGGQPNAIVPITTGNVLNTTSTYPAPYGNWYGGAHHQMLILASELTSAGLTAGYISGLAFQVTNIGTSAPLQNFTIDLAQTNVTSITTWQNAAFQTVYTNASYMPAVGVNIHNFSTPFYWDGVSNILVQTCFNNLSFSQNCVMRQTATAFSSTVYYRNDNEPGVCSNTAVTGTAFQRPNIAFLRSYASWTYNWVPSATIANPTVQNASAVPSASTLYIVTVTDTLTGCTGTDSVYVYVKPTPSPNFGPDTIICSNQPLLLDGTAGPYTYLWQDNSTAQTFSVNSFGNYYALVTDTTSGCAASDTILVGVNAAPSFSLGSDVTVCQGTQVTFSGPSGSYDYNWNTNDSTQTITTGTAGAYDLTITDLSNGCFGRDTIQLFTNPLPPVALGNDTALCSANAPYTLNAPVGDYAYLWNDNSTNQTLPVNASGTYYVTVTDNTTSCFDGDTVMVTINTSPVVALGNDTTFCSGNGPITLTAPAGPYNYLWSDSSTGNTFTTNSTGMVSVTLTDSVNGCTAMDTINITVPMSPVVAINDTTTCAGSVTLSGPAGPYSYNWSTTATTQNETITAPFSGNVSLMVTDTTSGCVTTDNANVIVNNGPTAAFSIAQSTICTTDAPLTLSGTPAGGTFSGPGVSGNTFNPATAGVGTYTIVYSYTDVNGCNDTASDVLTVSACVGINEPFVNAGMNVFPNPNNGQFTLTIKDADYSELTIELTTVEGQLVYSDKASNVKGDYVRDLDLTTHANGVYFLRVTANGQTFIQKIVKND